MVNRNSLSKNIGGAIQNISTVCVIFIVIITAVTVILQSTSGNMLIHDVVAKKHGNRTAYETITDEPKPNTNSSNLIFLNYDYPPFGLTIQYPATWEKVIYRKAVRSGEEGPLVNFLSPLDNSLDKFRDYLLVRLMNASDSIYVMNLTISNIPLYVANYTHEDPADPHDVLKTIRLWTDSGNGKVLVMEFTAKGSSYSKDLPLVAKMIGSLRMHGFA